MKKKILSTLLVLVVALTCALSLTACGLVDFWKGVLSGVFNGDMEGDIEGDFNDYIDSDGNDKPNDDTNSDDTVDSNSGLKYTLSADYMSYSVSQYATDKTAIVIPSEYKGRPVTSIPAYGFCDCTSLTRITIPDSVTEIGNGAFANCPITTATVSGVGCSAVQNPKLKTVVITGKNAVSGTFENCNSITSVTVSDGVTAIGELMFSNCSSLSSVTIPTSVTEIKRISILYCAKLSTLTYKGKSRDWREITKDNNWNNGTYFTITCTDHEITI